MTSTETNEAKFNDLCETVIRPLIGDVHGTGQCAEILWSRLNEIRNSKSDERSILIDLVRRSYLTLTRPHWESGQTDTEVSELINVRMTEILGEDDWREMIEDASQDADEY